MPHFSIPDRSFASSARTSSFQPTRHRLRMWGKPESSCCQVVLWAIDELGLDVELTLKGGGHGGLGDPEYVQINPNKIIPAIEDEGLILWESAAILLYLASTYGHGTLYPTDHRIRGDAYRWNVWMQTTLRPRLTPLFLEWTLYPPAARHLDDLEQRRLALHQTWLIIERHLAGKLYITGDTFTFADIALGVMANWWYAMPIDHFDLPNVDRWFARLRERPAFKARITSPPLPDRVARAA